MAEYEPGRRNIGPRERRKRRRFGLASLLVGAAYVAAVIALGWPPVALLGTFAFAFGAALGLLQASASFYIGYAVTERYDFADADGDAGRVRNAAAVRADRVRAGRLLAKALGVALVVTAVVYLVGLVVSRWLVA